MVSQQTTLAQTLFSPPVLVTVLICLVLGAIAVLTTIWVMRRVRERQLGQQRAQQESTIDRLLASFGADRDEAARQHEAAIAERDARIATLERDNARLRERLASSGLLGAFGGGKREAISALLLENEQLHELLAQKQEQMRELTDDLMHKLLDRLDEQAQDSARAVRYKQALLSAFLQQQETRQLLDRLLADGSVKPDTSQPRGSQSTSDRENATPSEP